MRVIGDSILKICIVSTSPFHFAFLFVKSLQKYADVVLTGTASHNYTYSFYQEEDIDIFCPIEDLDLRSFDYFIGLDHGSLQLLLYIKNKRPEAIVGMQILDYPVHILQINTELFNSFHYSLWANIKDNLNNLDFIISTKRIENYYLGIYYSDKPSLSLLYPTYPSKKLDLEEENIVVYSGRMSPDKRVEIIIEGMKRSGVKDVLYLIGDSSNQDVSSYIANSGVKHEILDGISDEDKYVIYNKAKFFLYSGYEYCPSGSILEALSIGKNAVCYDVSPTFLDYYSQYIRYGHSNIDIFADEIKSLSNNKELREKYSIERQYHFFNNLTFDIWAKKVIGFIYENFRKNTNI